MTRILSTIALLAILIMTAPATASQSGNGSITAAGCNRTSFPCDAVKQAGGGWDFREVSVWDSRTQMEVCRFEYPEGWSYDVELEWYEEPVPQFSLTIWTSIEDSPTAWGWVYPMAWRIWFEDESAPGSMPVGSEYAPQITVEPPKDACAYLEQDLMPMIIELTELGHEVEDFQMVDNQAREDIIDMFTSVMDLEGEPLFSEYDAAVANATLTVDGEPIESRVRAVVGYSDGPLSVAGFPSDMEGGYCALRAVTLESAPAGELESMSGLYEYLLSSIQFNPDFLSAYRGIREAARE